MDGALVEAEYKVYLLSKSNCCEYAMTEACPRRDHRPDATPSYDFAVPCTPSFNICSDPDMLNVKTGHHPRAPTGPASHPMSAALLLA
jgi:hypothetical protein